MSDTENQEATPEIEVEAAPEAVETEVKDIVAEEEAPVGQQAQEESPEEGIEILKARLKAAEEGRAMAEQQAAQQARVAHEAKIQVEDGNLALIRSAIDTVRQESSILKQHYAAAMSAGNFERAAEVQEDISTNASKLMQLENGRVALENRLKNPQFRQPPQPANMVDEFAARLSPKSAQWIRSHPEYVMDPNKHLEMLGAHNLAVGRRFVPDTPEYFGFIEQTLGMSQPVQAAAPVQAEAPVSAASQATQRRTAPPPAPSSKIASGNSGGKNVVRLTADQREAAKIAGMSPEDYAKNMLALKREGKLN